MKSRHRLYGILALMGILGALATFLLGISDSLGEVIAAAATFSKSGVADPAEMASDLSFLLLVGFYSLLWSLPFLLPGLGFALLYRKHRKREQIGAGLGGR